MARKRGKAEAYETRGDVLEKYPLLDNYYFEDHLINKKNLINNIFESSI